MLSLIDKKHIFLWSESCMMSITSSQIQRFKNVANLNGGKQQKNCSNLSICSSVKEILTYVKYFSIKNVDKISEFSHSKRQLSYGQFINNILTENFVFFPHGKTGRHPQATNFVTYTVLDQKTKSPAKWFKIVVASSISKNKF